MTAFDELLDLLLPTRCAVCGRNGPPICQACIPAPLSEPRRISREHLTGLVAREFGAVEQKLVHAFKDDGQTALSRFLAKPLVPLLLDLAHGCRDSILVPVPSSRQNYKKRGFRPTGILAAAINRQAKRPCLVANALSFVRQVDDQTLLDSHRRKTNLESSMMATELVRGRSVILFDDVITTGSTILEASRATCEAGGQVVGFLAFAETILKTGSKI